MSLSFFHSVDFLAFSFRNCLGYLGSGGAFQGPILRFG